MSHSMLALSADEVVIAFADIASLPEVPPVGNCFFPEPEPTNQVSRLRAVTLLLLLHVHKHTGMCRCGCGIQRSLCYV